MIDTNCPYNCNTSQLILDRKRSKLVPCPHCSKLAMDRVLEEEGFYKELGLSYDPNILPLVDKSILLGSQELEYLEPGSLDKVADKLKKVADTLRQGVLPDRSLLFSLGIRGRLMNAQYPLLSSAFLGGLKVHPLVSAQDLEIWKLREEIDQLDELYSSKVVVITIEEGASRAELQVCKGVMQVRASRGLPTIFVTTWSASSVATLVDSDDSAGMFLADPYIIQYSTENKDKYSKYVLGVLGLDNIIGDGSDSED